MDKLNVFQFLILLSAFGLLEKQKLQIGHEDTWDPEEHIASILAEHIILGMDESWSIQKMVKSSQLTRKKLNTIFKKYNGMTFRKFKISVRLGKAKELLITTSLRIHEISVRVGYPNPAHFSKLFKNKMGFPPSILRKRTSS
jgi:transcriptional regulator GlxA family with amidase domain